MIGGRSRHSLPLFVVRIAKALMQDGLRSPDTVIAGGEACGGTSGASCAERVEGAAGGAMYHRRSRRAVRDERDRSHIGCPGVVDGDVVGTRDGDDASLERVLEAKEGVHNPSGVEGEGAFLEHHDVGDPVAHRPRCTTSGYARA